MLKLFYYVFLFFSINAFHACKEKTVVEPILPEISIEDISGLEGNGSPTVLEFKVSVNGTFKEPITVAFKTDNASAFAGQDYESQSGILTFTAPNTSQIIKIVLIADEIKEADETFRVVLSSATNAKISDNIAIASIFNDDSKIDLKPDGYDTPLTYEGYTLTWADEFEGTTINEKDWTFEIGNGSGGWGNNELQYYTNRPENVKIENGKLLIEARKESQNGFQYTSTRMKTQDKRVFRLGRIDVRAKLPKGQGIWPAIWMLGNNITTVGWPACGEIDIMELVGHQASTTHGTAHWGSDVQNHKYKGSNYQLQGEDFSDRYHVFSIHWEENTIYWYMDDFLFYTITISQMEGQPYPFNTEFFFLLNVAVGGNWPGKPDATTVFPQQMLIDYVRVFQKK